MPSKKYDLISIGDCAIDAFIRIHDASVHCDLNNKNCMLCMSYADKIPYDTLDIVPAVGNSSNVAVGTARLGLRSAAFTAIGKNSFGEQIMRTYRKEKVSTEFVKVNPKIPTNYHFVINFQAERTILLKQLRYDYFDASRIGNTPWIYFSSVGEGYPPVYGQLIRHLKHHPQIKMGFNPGTFQIKLGPAKLRDVYRQTYVLFVNREEAQRILKLSTSSSSIKNLFQGLHKLGPKIILITDGPDGSYVSSANSKEQYYVPIYPDPAPPFERTGAGDASSTGFMAALIYGLSPIEAAMWAPINSMNVVQYTGAQKGLLTKSQLLKLLKKAPKNYKPKRI